MRIITGSARGARLTTLEGDATRPTAERVKEGMFSAIQFDLHDRKVLEPFGGSGQLSLEALSRGAESALICDESREAVAVIKENARLYLALLSFCFAIIAFQVFYPYLLTYIQYVVIPDNGGVENILKPGVIITAVIVAVLLLTCIVTLLRLSTKKRGICLVVGVVVLTLGFFMLSTSTNIYVILVSVLPVVLGNALVNILFSAAVKDFIPEGKAGLFQGIRMIFAVLLPMVIGPVIGDKACQYAAQTIINEAQAEVIVPAKNMFLWAGIVCILALIPLFFLIKKGVDSKESDIQKSESVA